jgi:hypothetical protein
MEAIGASPQVNYRSFSDFKSHQISPEKPKKNFIPVSLIDFAVKII